MEKKTLRELVITLEAEAFSSYVSLISGRYINGYFETSSMKAELIKGDYQTGYFETSSMIVALMGGVYEATP